MHENKSPLVSHFRDPRFLALRTLQTQQGRSRSGLFIIEGIRHLSRAVEEGAAIQSIFIDPSTLSNQFGRKLTRRLRRSGTATLRLTPQLYRHLTLAAEPQGVGAVVRQKWFTLSDVQVLKNSLWLAVESIESAGNLGTIIRTAEAAGVSGILLLDPGSDPHEPAAVRASMGSVFSQKLIRCSIPDLHDWARASHVSIVGSSPAGLLDYRALQCRWPVALVLGNEKQGLSPPLVESTDFMVRIPMRGRCDSINAAVAAGVLLFEIASHRPK